MGKRYGGYMAARTTLQTDAKIAVRRLHDAVESGTCTADEFLTMARDAVKAKLIAADVGRTVINISTPKWYRQPQDALNAAASERRLRSAKWADQLLTAARLAIADDRKVTSGVVFAVNEVPVSLGTIQRWAEPLHKLRNQRHKLASEGPRMTETEAEYADRIAPELNRMTKLLDTDDDLLASTIATQ